MPRGKIGNRIKCGSTEWINLTRPVKADVLSIGREFDLDADHLKALSTESHRSRLLDADGYMLLMLVHPTFDTEENDIVSKEIDLIITDTKVVTIQKSKIPVLHQMFNGFEFSSTKTNIANPATLIFSIMHELVLDIFMTMDTIAERLDDMERGILLKKHLLEDILIMQTNIIDVQKAVNNQNAMIDRFVSGLDTRTRTNIQEQYSELTMHFKEIQNSLAMERMTAQTLHSTHETVLNGYINDQVRLLTTLSLVILPATLLAGIFGMNVNLPILGGTPISFWIIMGLMGVSGVTVYIIGKLQK